MRLALIAALVSCSSPGPENVDASTSDGADIGVQFLDISRDVLAPRCSGVSCHSDGAVLSFAKRSAVVSAPARSAECSGFGEIVVPFDPAASLLYTKLTSPPCGNLMPLSLEPMPPELVESIRAWIEDGAP